VRRLVGRTRTGPGRRRRRLWLTEGSTQPGDLNRYSAPRFTESSTDRRLLRADVDTETRRAMFLREARIGRLQRHQNLVRTDDLFVEGEERFLGPELVGGQVAVPEPTPGGIFATLAYVREFALGIYVLSWLYQQVIRLREITSRLSAQGSTGSAAG
jgi:hypothetical protein